ncbi:N-acetyltransferase [Catellatospora methionotrophica]|uniref:N-acetyltransferase n=1 Tax=Catellatospora methionotrophica TaxID=121620 RepID=A0A8J3LD02_9ACTN|nr:GNAT family N-acetyltransferase [Catellatospora methionotrophica]GIG16430.1 N-acetyltransferase [Catellatospora methionotrophica]
MPTSPVFRTERLLVRPFDQADVASAYAMWSDPEVCRFTGDDPPSGIEVIAADIPRWQAVAERGAGCGFWAVTTLDGGFAGDVYVRPFDGRAGEHEVGWHLARSCWGRGYATEIAAGVLAHARRHGLDRLVALIDPGHAASRRVAEKAGMVFEGLSDRYDPGDPPVAVYAAPLP